MQRPSSPDIYELVAACLNGERLAQKELYQRYYGRLLAVTMRYAKGHDDAKAILNFAFLKIFTELSKYDPERDFFFWAKGITIHTAIDQIRKRTTYEKHLRGFTERISHERVEWNEALNALAVEDILKYIQKLPEATRTVFSLFEIEGYRHAEIAGILGISEGTSRWHLNEAKKRLRKMLSPFFELQINAA